MKKVELIAVGQLKEKFFDDAAAEYTKRLSRFCDFKLKELRDQAGSEAIKQESASILSAINGDFWLLDVLGEQHSSADFAKLIDREFMHGSLTFVIGGSNGVSDQVRQKASRKISFGAFTYPHQLMRIIFLEQLYRAFTITAGLPYHK